jgi:hypothetical protein
MCLTYWPLFISMLKYFLALWKVKTVINQNCEWKNGSFTRNVNTLLYSSLTSWNFPCSVLFWSLKCPQMSVKVRSHMHLVSSKCLTGYHFSVRNILSFSNCNRKPLQNHTFYSQWSSELYTISPHSL